MKARMPRAVSTWLGPTAIRFSLVGAATGLLLGVYEAALICWRSLHMPPNNPTVGPFIWILSPLIDLLVFGLLGFALGLAAEWKLSESKVGMALLVALGFGTAGKFAASLTLLSHFIQTAHGFLINGLLVLLSSGMGLGIFMTCTKRREGRPILPRQPPQVPLGWTLRAPLLAVLFLVAGVWVCWIRSPNLDLPPVISFGHNSHPNIVLIAVDTLAAGHSSAYGYARPTTPNIDALSRRGALFENAIAPSSWTYPCFVSMFTGLLPHQHGADFHVFWKGQSPALPEVLRSMGYETAGFNANWAYGGAATGLARGFEVYQDGSSTLMQNFARTLIGRYIEKWIYGNHDFLGRRDAQEVNREVYQWYRHRSGRPFFLFLNYFDAHDPYNAPAPYKSRFGDVPDDLGALKESREDPKTHNWRLSPPEREEVIAGYDNALAYADSQVGDLLKLLGSSPDWANTFVIVVADHGEAFGEHGRFGHSWDLHRELLHVPLMVIGPGVPAGLRIPDVVGTRRIFETVLDLATHPEAPPQSSLRRFWAPGLNHTDAPDAIISELHRTMFIGDRPHSMVSLTTDRWHFIQDTQGSCELFDWTRDPIEQTNLASAPEGQSIIVSFQAELGHRLSESNRPWWGPYYLLAVGAFRPPLHDVMESHALPAGKSSPEQQELLESLPYH